MTTKPKTPKSAAEKAAAKLDALIAAQADLQEQMKRQKAIIAQQEKEALLDREAEYGKVVTAVLGSVSVDDLRVILEAGIASIKGNPEKVAPVVQDAYGA